MRLAVTGAYRARWSAQIHDEWKRNLLVKRPDLTVDQVNRTSALMDRAIPDALVTDYESIVAQLDLPDADDRHVLAAAQTCLATKATTTNTVRANAAPMLNGNHVTRNVVGAGRLISSAKASTSRCNCSMLA